MSTGDASEELLTVDEVAARLRVNPQTVRKWLRERTLRGFRLSARGWRVRRVDVDDFLRKRQEIAELERQLYGSE